MHHNNLCSAAQSQLLIIDIQERLAAAMETKDREGVLNNTSILLQAATLLEIPAVKTEQYPKGLGPTEKGLLDHMPADSNSIEKMSFSCCANDEFCASALEEERKQFIIAGMETHVCVLQTAFELQQRGYQPFVVADAVCSRTGRNRRIALQRMRQAGITITSTESVLFEWLRDATHPQFRTISKMLR
jgi:nicotinamidase-related amidase